MKKFDCDDLQNLKIILKDCQKFRVEIDQADGPLTLRMLAAGSIHEKMRTVRIDNTVQTTPVSGGEMDADHVTARYVESLNARTLELLKTTRELEQLISIKAIAHGLGFKRSVRHAGSEIDRGVPRLGEFILLCVLSKKARESLPGDLAEEFAEIVLKHGLRKAHFWYWCQVVRSIGPLVRLGLVSSLIAWMLRQFGR